MGSKVQLIESNIFIIYISTAKNDFNGLSGIEFFNWYAKLFLRIAKPT